MAWKVNSRIGQARSLQTCWSFQAISCRIVVPDKLCCFPLVLSSMSIELQHLKRCIDLETGTVDRLNRKLHSSISDWSGYREAISWKRDLIRFMVVQIQDLGSLRRSSRMQGWQWCWSSKIESQRSFVTCRRVSRQREVLLSCPKWSSLMIQLQDMFDWLLPQTVLGL